MERMTRVSTVPSPVPASNTATPGAGDGCWPVPRSPGRRPPISRRRSSRRRDISAVVVKPETLQGGLRITGRHGGCLTIGSRPRMPCKAGRTRRDRLGHERAHPIHCVRGDPAAEAEPVDQFAVIDRRAGRRVDSAMPACRQKLDISSSRTVLSMAPYLPAGIGPISVWGRKPQTCPPGSWDELWAAAHRSRRIGRRYC